MSRVGESLAHLGAYTILVRETLSEAVRPPFEGRRILYDLDQHKVNQTRFGIGYIDDCFILALNYSTSYSYDVTGNNPIRVNAVMLQFALRTLGSSTVTQNVSTSATQN